MAKDIQMANKYKDNISQIKGLCSCQAPFAALRDVT